MGDKKKQKFSLGDIIQKLNETEKKDDGKQNEGNQRQSMTADSPVSEKQPAPTHSTINKRDFTTSPAPQTSPSAPFLAHDTAAPVHKAPFHHTFRNAATISPPETHSEASTGTASPSGTQLHGDNDTVDFDIMRYFGILIRRKNIVVIALIIASVFSVYSYVKAVRLYTAHARLLFSPGYQDIMGNNQTMFITWGSREEKINTHLELLKSQTVLKLVASNLNGTIKAGALAGGIAISRGMIDGEKNDIIDISFSHPNAEAARDVINEVCKTYVEYIKAVSVQDIAVLITKLDDQIAKTEKDLDEKENTLRIFKENNRSVQLSSEANLAISKLTQVETANQQTQIDMLECKEKLMGLQKEINQQQVDIIESSTYQNPYQSRLAELELELSTLSAEYSPEHFKVRMIKAEIDKIKEAMKSDLVKEAASKTFVKNPIRQSLLQDLVTVTIDKSVLDAKRNAQEQISKDLDSELRKLPSVELHFAQLTRETESLLQVLKLLKTRYEEAKIKRDSQDSDLKILEWAQTPSHAISNFKFSKIIIALFIGLIIGIIFALLLEYLDQSIKEPEEIERLLEVPLLGIVPMIEMEKAIIDSSPDRGKTMLEPFRALRANIKHIAEKRGIKTFIIASAVKGEGKTTLAANIAITFSMDGKKVILVDGDLRRAQIHHLFNLPKKIGLCDYLLGAAETQDILKPTLHHNLFVITAGEHPQNPAELVGSSRLSELIKELRDIADVVIFDSPALLPVSDVLSMAPKMDACIMVVRALWTPLKAAQQAKNQLQRIGCTIIGALMNGISLSRGYYPYYYGYYRYYAYKYSYDDVGDSKFSLRKFGLMIESKCKNFLLSTKLSLPRWTSSCIRHMQNLFRRKTFWVLLLIAVALSIANVIALRFAPYRQQKENIIFIGSVDELNKKKTPSRWATGGREAKHVMPLEAVSPSISRQADNDSAQRPADSIHSLKSAAGAKSDTLRE
jgi:polysaccharide biosynthesis transport protein